MKLHPLFFAVPLLLSACNQSQPTQNQVTTENIAAAEQPIPAATPPTGMYVGSFDAAEYDENKDISYSNKITMAIETLEHGMVKGYSVVAGNSRPFEGTYTENGNVINAATHEPGNDKYDGAFNFQILRDSQMVTGSWKANDRKLGVTKRTFNLKKRDFHYNPALELAERDVSDDAEEHQALYALKPESGYGADEYEVITEDAIKFNASQILLAKADVENMSKGDLEVTRNAIYARHGYSFKNRRMRYVFDQVDWYMPVSTNITQDLTALELKNIDLLKRYEQHAERYYDSFGR